MLSENVQMFLFLVRDVLWFGIIGFGVWFSIGIMLEAKIQEKIVLAIMKDDENREKD